MPPDKLLHNSLKHNAARLQLIELLPRRGGGWSALHALHLTRVGVFSLSRSRGWTDITIPAWLNLGR
jgi:hypothetical protein